MRQNMQSFSCQSFPVFATNLWPASVVFVVERHSDCWFLSEQGDYGRRQIETETQ